ncbi:MAG: AraC family transcriptional regulator [Alphaproteobacteria bacterium]|nr:AraC family transcriptional regulator [Alphaproteobacteria bacterium]
MRSIKPGRERVSGPRVEPRHRHHEAYLLIAVSGAFEQASYGGRHIVAAGDILVQPTLDAHANALRTDTLEVLRLPWRYDGSLGGRYRSSDLDLLVRTAEKDVHEACALVERDVEAQSPLQPQCADWPDHLASELATGRAACLSEWADQHGLVPETISRGFGRVFGVSASAFRLELKSRRAWLEITGTGKSMATIAAECGFADQAHMSRSVFALTGVAPSYWREPRLTAEP